MTRTDRTAQAAQRRGNSRRTGLVRRVVEREVGRISLRGRRLLAKLDELMRRYPSASKLAGEVEAVARAHRRFIAALQQCDWPGAIDDAGGRLAEMIAASDDPRVLRLRWVGEPGGFCVDGNAPVWRLRSEEPTLDVVELIGARLQMSAPADEPEGDDLAEPLRRAGADHRAVVSTLGWAVVTAAACRRLDADGRLREVRLRGGGDDIRLQSAHRPPLERLPGPEAFGFQPRDATGRRLERFVDTDPQAHFHCWVDRPRDAPGEMRVLRKQRGGRIRLELDRRLRRLRIIRRPESEVVRNRRHVFVDEQPATTRDHFWATARGLENATERKLREWIAEGWRIVYLRLEFDDEVHERGSPP